MPVQLPFQASRKFASSTGQGSGSGMTFSILATQFINDAGVAATAFPSTYSYYILNVNGVLQLSNTSTVTVNSVTIPNGDTLDFNTPVLLEFIIN